MIDVKFSQTGQIYPSFSGATHLLLKVSLCSLPCPVRPGEKWRVVARDLVKQAGAGTVQRHCRGYCEAGAGAAWSSL